MDVIYLIGAEDIKAAGYAMWHDADAARQAANRLDDAPERHRQWLDTWLLRFETAIEKVNNQ